MITEQEQRFMAAGWYRPSKASKYMVNESYPGATIFRGRSEEGGALTIGDNMNYCYTFDEAQEICEFYSNVNKAKKCSGVVGCGNVFFGDGKVCIAPVVHRQGNKVVYGMFFSELEEGYEVGDYLERDVTVTSHRYSKAPVKLFFKNKKSIDVLIEQLQELKCYHDRENVQEDGK